MRAPCHRTHFLPETFTENQHALKHLQSASNATLPGARVVAQLVHVRVVLGHNGDGVALLPDDETSLLLRSIPQVDAVVLIRTERCHEAETGNRKKEVLSQ